MGAQKCSKYYELCDDRPVDEKTDKAKHIKMVHVVNNVPNTKRNLTEWVMCEKTNITKVTVANHMKIKKAMWKAIQKKSRIRETPTLWTDADSGTDTNLKRKRDLSRRRKK